MRREHSWQGRAQRKLFLMTSGFRQLGGGREVYTDKINVDL